MTREFEVELHETQTHTRRTTVTVRAASFDAAVEAALRLDDTQQGWSGDWETADTIIRARSVRVKEDE